MTYVYNGILEKWSRIKWYTRSICTQLYINFDGLYIIMNSPYRSLCTKFIIYAIILYRDQIVRRSFFMAPTITSFCFIHSNIQIEQLDAALAICKGIIWKGRNICMKEKICKVRICKAMIWKGRNICKRRRTVFRNPNISSVPRL